MTTKNEVHTVPGVIGTRKSPRNYTHALVVTNDPDWNIKHMLPREIAMRQSMEKDNWQWAHKRSQMTPGVSLLFPASWGNPHKATEKDVAEGKAFLAKHPTLADHMNAVAQELRDRYEQRRARGVYRAVFSWHQSRVLAQKAASALAAKQQYKHVEVCETVRGGSAPKATGDKQSRLSSISRM